MIRIRKDEKVTSNIIKHENYNFSFTDFAEYSLTKKINIDILPTFFEINIHFNPESNLSHANIVVLSPDIKNKDLIYIRRYEPHGSSTKAYDFHHTVEGVKKLFENQFKNKTFVNNIVGQTNYFGDTEDEDSDSDSDSDHEYETDIGFQTIEAQNFPKKWKFSSQLNPTDPLRIEKTRGFCRAFCYLFVEYLFIKGDDGLQKFLLLKEENDKNQYFLSDLIRSYIGCLLNGFESVFPEEFKKSKEKTLKKYPNIYSKPIMVHEFL